MDTDRSITSRIYSGATVWVVGRRARPHRNKTYLNGTQPEPKRHAVSQFLAVPVALVLPSDGTTMPLDANDPNLEPVVFRFDRTIADLIPKFLSRCSGRLANIKQHLDDSDLEAIEMIGLELVGAGEPFGFPRISALGREIVIGAQKADTIAILAAVGRLQTHLEALAAIQPADPLP